MLVYAIIRTITVDENHIEYDIIKVFKSKEDAIQWARPLAKQSETRNIEFQNQYKLGVKNLPEIKGDTSLINQLWKDSGIIKYDMKEVEFIE